MCSSPFVTKVLVWSSPSRGQATHHGQHPLTPACACMRVHACVCMSVRVYICILIHEKGFYREITGILLFFVSESRPAHHSGWTRVGWSHLGWEDTVKGESPAPRPRQERQGEGEAPRGTWRAAEAQASSADLKPSWIPVQVWQAAFLLSKQQTKTFISESIWSLRLSHQKQLFSFNWKSRQFILFKAVLLALLPDF